MTQCYIPSQLFLSTLKHSLCDWNCMLLLALCCLNLSSLRCSRFLFHFRKLGLLRILRLLQNFRCKRCNWSLLTFQSLFCILLLKASSHVHASEPGYFGSHSAVNIFDALISLWMYYESNLCIFIDTYVGTPYFETWYYFCIDQFITLIQVAARLSPEDT